jgi:hypothetical protein
MFVEQAILPDKKLPLLRPFVVIGGLSIIVSFFHAN